MSSRILLATLLLAGCASQPLSRSPSGVRALSAYKGVYLQCFNDGVMASLGFTHGVFWVYRVFQQPIFDRMASSCATGQPSETGSCTEKDNGLTCTLGAKGSLLRVEYADLKSPDAKDKEQGHDSALFAVDADFRSQSGWRCYVYDQAHSPSREDENPGDCGGG